MANYGFYSCDEVLKDLEEREGDINKIKNSNKSENDKNSIIEDERAYQLNMLIEYENNCMNEDAASHKEVHRILKNIFDEPLTETNKSIIKKLLAINPTMSGGRRKTRSRKSKSKRTRRMRR